MKNVFVVGGSVSLTNQAGALTVSTTVDPTTTRVALSYPSTARWITFRYRNLPGSTAVTGQYIKVVLNATSDADANGKLASVATCMVITQGDDVVLSSAEITRVDFITAQAVGAEKTLFSVMAGI
jgi:hypothetical protein